MKHCNCTSASTRTTVGARTFVQVVLATCAAAFLALSPRAHSEDLSTQTEVFDGCGTVIVDEFYYCYLFQADSDGKIYAVPGIDSYAYLPGDRLHVQGISEPAVSFCTLDAIILDPSISSCDQECAADIDGNGSVEVFDMLTLLSQWGPCSYSCSADLDDNGSVDVFDLLTLLSAWGPCE